MVAALGAMRTWKTVVARAPSRARVSCGALAAHWPIAAKERARVSTAEQAASSTYANE